jgi:hypothetical protein
VANFTFAYNLNGENSVPVVKTLPVKDGQTIAVGDALVIDTNAVAKAGATFGECVGVAMEAVTSASGDSIEVAIAQPSQVWKATASADATSHVLGVATYDLTAAQLINVADTTGGSVRIVELGDSVTDVRVVFAVCALG